jgi:hypothetical protein
MSSSRISVTEGQGLGTKPFRPNLTFRDSTASSIVSRGTNGGDKHDVVSVYDASTFF